MKTLIAALLTLGICTCHAQITLKKYDEPGKSGYKSIVFEYEEESAKLPPGQAKKKVKKEFDIEKNTPYNAKIQTVPGLAKKYDYGKRKTFTTDPHDQDLFQNGSFKAKGHLKDHQISQYTQWSHVKTEGDYTILQYGLDGLDQNGFYRNQIAEFKVFDKKGSLIGEFESKTGFNGSSLTKNGKFLGITYGGVVDDSGFKIFPSGYVIYDVKKGVEIFRKELSDGLILKAPTNAESLLVFTCQNSYSKGYVFEIFDFSKRLYYKNELTQRETWGLKEITVKGVKFMHNGEEVWELYEKDFEKIAF